MSFRSFITIATTIGPSYHRSGYRAQLLTLFVIPAVYLLLYRRHTYKAGTAAANPRKFVITALRSSS